MTTMINSNTYAAASCKQKIAMLSRIQQIYSDRLSSHKKFNIICSILSFNWTPEIANTIIGPTSRNLALLHWHTYGDTDSLSAIIAANMEPTSIVCGGILSWQLYRCLRKIGERQADNTVKEYINSLSRDDRMAIMPNNLSELESIKKNVFKGYQTSCDNFMNVLDPKVITEQ
jgi:hypothetical protein